MAGKEPDPTKDPEFQKVVQTFLHTKPHVHKPKKKAVKKPPNVKPKPDPTRAGTL
jgi:hypothetical protein